MGWLRRIGLVTTVFLGGCVPSMEAKSAGEIGCTPEDIVISNEKDHFGLIQSGKTWMAECQGRTYVCSQINESGNDKDIFDALFASEQVSCHEAPESPQAERNRRAEEAVLAERANRPPSTAPSGAAGFLFGETPEMAAQRCEAAGQTWRSDAGNSACSGPAASLGIAARVALQFCDGRTCSIMIEHVPSTNWSQSSVSLKANLQAKYGLAQESNGNVPEACRSERAFMRCLESRQVRLSYTWRWAGGESLDMSVGKADDRESAAIRLVYRRPANAANASAL
jgi:hypothetical protein